MPGIGCPECGGSTRFIPAMKRVVCEVCGLALTRKEMEEARSEIRKEMDLYDDHRRAERKSDTKKQRDKEWQAWWSDHESEE